MAGMVNLGEVVKEAGGSAAVAEALGVSQSVVCNWIRRNKVSAGKVLEFERLTGISRHLLRSDIHGPMPRAA